MSRLDNFKDIVDSKLGDVSVSDAMKERVRQGIAEQQAPKRRFRPAPFVAAAGLVAACAILALIYVPRGAQAVIPSVPTSPPVINIAPQEMTMKAVRETAVGVSTDSGFTLSLPGTDMDGQTLKSSIVVLPALDFEVTAEGEGEYTLSPTEPMQKNTVYTFALAAAPEGADAPVPMSWAFQTEAELTVISRLPADSTSGVPVNTGIEVTFSAPVDVKPGDVEISPAADGHIEMFGRTMVFVPSSPLSLDTVYTFTVKAGAGAAGGLALAEDCVFSFRTEEDYSGDKLAMYLSGGINEIAGVGETVALGMSSNHTPYNNKTITEEMQVNVFAIPTAEKYLELVHAHTRGIHASLGRAGDYVIDTASLSSVADFAQVPIYSDYRYLYYIILPDRLELGYYLIEAKLEDVVVQKLLCVSNLSIWQQSVADETLLWLNDASSGKPVAGAEVNAGGNKGVTDAGGIAVLETPDGDTFDVYAAAGGDSAAFIASPGQREPAQGQMYYSFMYTDRQIYQPNDTVRLWGYISPKIKGVEMPGSVTLSCDSMSPMTVSVNEGGAFEAEIVIENSLSTYLSVSLMMDGEMLSNRWVTVTEYEKPVYVLSAEPGKPYYRLGEPVSITVTSEFFDGTPATGLLVSTDRASDGLSSYTDSAGNATFSFAERVQNSWWPYYDYMYINAGSYETGGGSANKAVPRFPSDYMMELELAEGPDGTRTLEAVMSAIDFEAVDTWFAGGKDIHTEGFYDAIRGQSISQQINVDVFRQEYIREQSGEHYDFISKKTIPVYSYREEVTLADRFTMTVEPGGSSSKTLDYIPENRVSYYLDIGYTGPDGLYVVERMYYPQIGSLYESDYKTYSLTTDKTAYVEGESALLKLNENYEPTESTGRILYTAVGADMILWDITQSSGFTVGFTGDMVPGCMVYGAYFDGKHIFPVEPAVLRIDLQSRGLDIKVETDSVSYRPGGTVKADVTITDKDGAPVAAQFALSAVDEAVFALAEQYVDPLGQILEPYYGRTMSTFASYRQPGDIFRGAAEGGGEGMADSIRSDFMDNAAFITGVTDAGGTAAVEFKLADNLTSWRITCVAVADGPRAGTARVNIPATLPFFINLGLSKSYVQGDEIVVSARAAGSAISAGDAVKYSVTLSGGGQTIKADDAGGASEHRFINLGKLPAGQYDVTVTAQCGKYTDGEKHTISVYESRIEMPVAESMPVASLQSLTAARYPVDLMLYDSDNAKYAEALFSMLRGGERADQKICAAIASKELGRLMPEWTGDEALQKSARNVQKYTGGVPLLEYSGEETLLTAKILAAGSEYIDREAAIAYLNNIAADRNAAQSEVVAALMGLAAAKQPVLLDIRRIFEESSDLLTLRERIQLMTGLAYLGDIVSAKSWYDENITPKLKATGAWLSVDAGDDAYAATGEAVVLSALVGASDAGKLLDYVMGTDSDVYLPLLDIAQWLRLAPGPGASKAKLSYMKDGQRITVDLSKEIFHHVVMGKRQLEEAAFSTQGDITVTASYVAAAEDIKAKSDAVTIEKFYGVSDQYGITVTIKMTFGGEAPEGWYTLADVLPSGLRYSGTDYNNNRCHLISQDGGRAVFAVGRTKGPDVTVPTQISLTYYARVAIPGSYISESPIIRHVESGLIAAGQRGVYTAP